MPKAMVIQVFLEKVQATEPQLAGPVPLTAQIDAYIGELAQLFNVSLQAMKIRLIQLGLLLDRVYDFDDEI